MVRAALFNMLVALCLLSSGCASSEVTISSPHVGLAQIEKPINEKLPSPGKYLFFSFQSESPQIDTQENLLQLRVNLVKGDKITAYSIGRGPYVTDGTKLELHKKNGSSYAAFDFKELKLYLDDGGKVPLSNVDFDYIEIQLTHPLMGLGSEFTSNKLTFQRKDILEALDSSPRTFE
ncbi:hypothetical protein HCH_02173 [Hahella chejuensis KCTC 2396]|uniref:DUF2846 domain-containing protein n=1 Tax=Hahella chejuensis (strain KCTC 2396) TaxID=349521 RepID=Q2SK23_HAHCH|nr:hypothetical protein [Hahella chejuensis]ABC29001.1 hypothetical protein HCH_02173 [Hahella chejuensis KCTC 2396]